MVEACAFCLLLRDARCAAEISARDAPRCYGFNVICSPFFASVSHTIVYALRTEHHFMPQSHYRHAFYVFSRPPRLLPIYIYDAAI